MDKNAIYVHVHAYKHSIHMWLENDWEFTRIILLGTFIDISQLSFKTKH